MECAEIALGGDPKELAGVRPAPGVVVVHVGMQLLVRPGERKESGRVEESGDVSERFGWNAQEGAGDVWAGARKSIVGGVVGVRVRCFDAESVFFVSFDGPTWHIT